MRGRRRAWTRSLVFGLLCVVVARRAAAQGTSTPEERAASSRPRTRRRNPASITSGLGTTAPQWGHFMSPDPLMASGTVYATSKSTAAVHPSLDFIAKNGIRCALPKAMERRSTETDDSSRDYRCSKVLPIWVLGNGLFWNHAFLLRTRANP
jgi:hypothetical protein